jgi:hypothetical protein
MLTAALAALIAIGAVVVAVVTSTSGGGARTAGFATPAPTASGNLTTTASESVTTFTANPVESATVQQVLNEYESDYSNENIEGLEGLFSQTLTRRDGTDPSENLAQAIQTYKKQFSELVNPSYTLSNVYITPGTGQATASATYGITSQNGTVTGTIDFHMTEEEPQQVRIDELTIAPANQAIK